MTQQLAGKTAIITGASSGIGRSAAKLLAKEGATLYLLGRSADRLREVQKEVEDQGAKAVSVPMDIRDFAAIDHVVDQAVAETGTLNIMINNAGLSLGHPVIDANPEDWREMYEVNVLALLKGAQSAVRAMRKGGFSGHIVNVSSVAAREGQSGVYGSTKAAVNYIGGALRQELENDPIRVVQILPGAVLTNFGRHMPAERVRGLLNATGAQVDFNTGDILSDEVIDQAQGNLAKAFLAADDVARAIHFAVTQPITVDIFEIDIRPQGSLRPRS
jgi:NADP-dependent 3-hydroxy acid dehydrogenase YdfG